MANAIHRKSQHNLCIFADDSVWRCGKIANLITYSEGALSGADENANGNAND